MKKEPVIKTKRMLLSPMSDQEIEKLIETTESEEMRIAYGEMLSGCKSDPGNRVWYAPWKMTLRSVHSFIGDLAYYAVRDLV